MAVDSSSKLLAQQELSPEKPVVEIVTQAPVAPVEPEEEEEELQMEAIDIIDESMKFTDNEAETKPEQDTHQRPM